MLGRAVQAVPKLQSKVTSSTTGGMDAGASGAQAISKPTGCTEPSKMQRGEKGQRSKIPQPLNHSEGRDKSPILSGSLGGGDVSLRKSPSKANRQRGVSEGSGSHQRCILCQITTRDLQKHVLDTHLPNGFYEAHPSEIISAMMMLAEALGIDFYSLEARIQQMIFPRQEVWKPSEKEKEFFLKMGKHMGVPVQEPFILTPPNNLLFCMQWSVLLRLLITAGKEARERFRALSLSSATQGAAISPRQTEAPIPSKEPRATMPPQRSYAQVVRSRSVTSDPEIKSTEKGIKLKKPKLELPPELIQKMKVARAELKKEKRKEPVKIENITFSRAELDMLPKTTKRTYIKACNKWRREATEGGSNEASSVTEATSSVCKVPKISETSTGQTSSLPSTSTASKPKEVVDPVTPAEEEMEIENPKEEGTKIQMIDAHFHLDRSFDKLRGKNRVHKNRDIALDLPSLLAESHCSTPEDAQLLGAVASFCDPCKMRSLIEDKHLCDHLERQSDLKLCFGLHPNHAEEITRYQDIDKCVDAVTTLSQLNNVVAFGEIGLDFHRFQGIPRKDLDYQKDLLKTILSKSRTMLIDRGLPVVIHCREDSWRGSGARFEDSACCQTINILKQYLPREHKVYVHFFTGGSKEIGAWIGAFPNVVFGLIGQEHSRLVINDWSLRELFCEQKVVAETDAPYMERIKGKPKTSMDIYHLLQEVQKRLPPIKLPGQPESKASKLSLKQVAESILENTRNFFNM